MYYYIERRPLKLSAVPLPSEVHIEILAKLKIVSFV